MRKNGIWIGNIVLAVVLTGSMALAQTPETAQKDPNQPPQVRCTGKVVDGQGQPLAGASVELYRIILVDENNYSFEVEKTKEAITENEGAFSFETAKEENNQSNQSVLLAQKEGFSIGWANWIQRDNLETTITLGQPADLAGRVVDEADQPVAGAQVGIAFLLVNLNNEPRYMIQKISKKLLTAVTDQQGNFIFSRLPAEATAEFAVEKAGRATVNTFHPGNYQGNVLQFKPGQKDIKIVQPLEAIIEGQVVEKDSGKPAAGIRLAAQQVQNPNPFGPDPVLSDAEGLFRLNGLTAGSWTISLVQSREALAEWVAAPVEVTAEVGKAGEGVKIELSKGGIIEVKVTDEETKQPVPKANVVIHPAEGGRSLYMQSDPQGLARLRVLPGSYRLSGVYMQGGGGMQQRDEAITVEEGKTVQMECLLAGPTKIAGVVRDEAGQPVEGAQVAVYPMSRQGVSTDKEGRFEVEWNPDEWGSNQPTVYYLVVRHKERNLAGSVEIQKDTKTMDVTVKPGMVFSGKVVNPEGQGIDRANVTVMLRAGSWGSGLRDERIVTDAEGNFEIQAIPPEHKYDIYARADGYGQSRQEVRIDEAVDGRLEVGTLVLKPANLTLIGVVVDTEDQPVAGADIYGHGEGQPDLYNIKTDEQGKFTLKVCEGRLNIQANVQGAKRMRGSIETEGGVAEVKIVVSETGSDGRFVPKEPASLVGKALPDLAALSLAMDPAATKDQPVLLCFCDMNQRPSRHTVQELVKKTEELKEKGVVVAMVQAEPMEQKDLDGWITKYQIPFPCGLLKDQPNKTKFAWGVKALPWLILTDRHQVVQAEGFAVNELEDIVKNTIEK